MDAWQIILIIIGVYVLALIIYSFLLYGIINKSIGRRTDKNPMLKYFTAEDYDGLIATPLSFKNKKGTTLNGFIYHNANTKNNAIMVFFHGFGAGHQAYTTLINDLVNKVGYPILTFDYTGCDLSEGKKIPNTLQALADGHDFLAYIKTLDDYKDRPMILIGHSWGGFVATNLYPMNKDKKIIKVVALNSVTDFPLFYKITTRAPFIFIPINNMLNYFKYGQLAFCTTRKCIKDTPVPHLFIHGEKDESIPFTPFISSLVLQSDIHKRVKFHFEKDRYHNAYLTNESETELRKLQANMKAYRRAKDKEALHNEIMNFDFNLAVQNDEKIIAMIDHFIKETKYE